MEPAEACLYIEVADCGHQSCARKRSTTAGVLHRDDDASNPLFDTHAKAGMSKRLAGGMASAVGLKKKKRDSKADQAMVRAPKSKYHRRFPRLAAASCLRRRLCLGWPSAPPCTTAIQLAPLLGVPSLSACRLVVAGVCRGLPIHSPARASIFIVPRPDALAGAPSHANDYQRRVQGNERAPQHGRRGRATAQGSPDARSFEHVAPILAHARTRYAVRHYWQARPPGGRAARALTRAHGPRGGREAEWRATTEGVASLGRPPAPGTRAAARWILPSALWWLPCSFAGV